YSLRALIHINLDLVTAFTTLPLSLLGFAGVVLLAAGGVATALCLALAPASWLPAAASLTLIAVGALFVATGVLGQYLGRVYRQVAGGGPAFVVRSGPR